jgi:uncharacterized membrane protein
MKTVMYTLLLIHILSGFVALLTGGISMLMQKGGKVHRKAGKGFFYAMISVGVTALIIAFFKDIYFLLMIAVFALYLTIMGYRSLLFMRKAILKPTLFDWFFAAFSLAFIAATSWLFFVRTPLSVAGMQPVLAVLNSIFLILIIRQSFNYLNFNRKTANDWLIQHIIFMMAAYIATITAFLVTNVHSNPAFIVWLTPTVLFTPLIFYFIAKYRTKGKVQAAVSY